jgi:hypothetical protein
VLLVDDHDAEAVERDRVQVVDAYGNAVWNSGDLPPSTGASEVSTSYGGPLEAGMYYRFSVTPVRTGSSITTSEQHRGVFFRM